MAPRLLPAAWLLAAAALPLLSSCASRSGSTSAEVPAPADSTAPEPAVQAGVPEAARFESAAPNEVVSEAVRGTRRTAVTDMQRLGTIAAFQQGPVGVLRTAVGERFHTSNTRELQYPKLVSAYSTWTTPGRPIVVELWERGEKIGEFTEGRFLMGPGHTAPIECAGPGPGGICGYGPGGPPETIARAPSPAPPPAAARGPTTAPPGASESRHGGLHLNFGVGAGAADITCEEVCDYPSSTALSGYFGVGAAVRATTVLGVEGTGWTRSESGADARMYSLMATGTEYASPTSGFFLTLGIGFLGYREDVFAGELAANALGYSARLGYELRPTGRLTFSPYVGFVSTFRAVVIERNGERTGEFNINNLQAGLAVGVN